MTHEAVSLYAIILAGGSGARLWPLSRPDRPKHLLPLLEGVTSLLQATARRVTTVVDSRRVWTVTQDRQADEVRRQLSLIAPDLASGVLSEPTGRNTLPAVAWAVLKISMRHPNALVSVFPSDHWIAEIQAFQTAWNSALSAARRGFLMTIGIRPKGPETGYGYIRLGEPLTESGSYQADAFVEKPDLSTARSYLASGGYLWNSGIFVFSVSSFLEDLKSFQPSMEAVLSRLAACETLEGSNARDYASLPSLSVDHGLLEKSRRVGVVPADMGWSDLGSWDALRKFFNDDLKPSPLMTVLLDEVQKVSVTRPWGTYTVLEEGPGYKIKRIIVGAGQKLSLQRHRHRAEHWVVIEGTAKVTCGEKVLEMKPNESTFIPLGEKHRLENPGSTPLVIIEIQTGSYVGEDDIERFDDVYGRVSARESKR